MPTAPCGDHWSATAESQRWGEPQVFLKLQDDLHGNLKGDLVCPLRAQFDYLDHWPRRFGATHADVGADCRQRGIGKGRAAEVGCDSWE